GFVSCQKILSLVFDDGTHSKVQCFLTLAHCINKPFGGIQFLFNKQNGFFIAFRSLGSFCITAQHSFITSAYLQFGSVSSVQCKFQFPFVFHHHEVRRNGAEWFPCLLTGSSGSWI